MNRTQARTQARQEYLSGYGLMRAGDKAYVQGRRAEADALYAQGRQHFDACDEFCGIAAGTRKALSAPVRPATVTDVAPDDF